MNNENVKRKRTRAVEAVPVDRNNQENIRSASEFAFKRENSFKMSQTSDEAKPSSMKLKLLEANVQPSEVKLEPQEHRDESHKRVKWEPDGWLVNFSKIKQMRSDTYAPVDTMGCESNYNHNSPPHVKRYHILVSLMLSSQTKDEVTAKAMSELHKLPLEIDVILNTDEEKLAQTIYPVSFYKRKAQYIKKTSQILKEKYNYDIPDSVEELCKLPGVGPKMAYLTMSCGWKKVVGIGVDTHVHRIANRLGWTRIETKTPEHTRKELEEWLPQCHWNDVNNLFVGFGQTICRPVGPKCSECRCNDTCPTGKKQLQAASKKSKGAKIKIEKDE